MRIEIKSNHIVVEFSEKESSFIAQRAGEAKADDIADYIKAKISKAFKLEDLEDGTIFNLGNDFNLNKIKNVTDELKKRKEETGKAQTKVSDLEKSAKDSAQAGLTDKTPVIGKEPNSEIKEADNELIEVGDELLADLLDKDLLKSRKKPDKGE